MAEDHYSGFCVSSAFVFFFVYSFQTALFLFMINMQCMSSIKFVVFVCVLVFILRTTNSQAACAVHVQPNQMANLKRFHLLLFLFNFLFSESHAKEQIILFFFISLLKRNYTVIFQCFFFLNIWFEKNENACRLALVRMGALG